MYIEIYSMDRKGCQEELVGVIVLCTNDSFPLLIRLSHVLRSLSISGSSYLSFQL